MTKEYRVGFVRSLEADFYVNAESEEEAEALATEIASNADDSEWSCIDTNCDGVECQDEEEEEELHTIDDEGTVDQLLDEVGT